MHPHCNCALLEVLDTDEQPQFYDTLRDPGPATPEEHDEVAPKITAQINSVFPTSGKPKPKKPKPVAKPKPAPRVRKPKPEPEPIPEPVVVKPVPVVEPVRWPTAKPPKPVPPPARPAEPGPGNFEHVWQVVEWAKKVFPHATDLRMDGIPVQSWNVITTQLDKLLKQYPEVAHRIETFGSHHKMWDDRTIPGALAAASARTGNILAFNPDQWQDLDYLTRTLDNYGRSHWMAKGAGDPAYVVTHEFGHLLDGHIWRKDGAKHAKLYKLFGVNSFEVEYDGELRPGAAPLNAETAKTVSRYATTNILETFAETFASMHFTPLAERAAVVNQFEEILKR